MTYAPSSSFFWAASEQKHMSTSWRTSAGVHKIKPFSLTSPPLEIAQPSTYMLACKNNTHDNTHMCTRTVFVVVFFFGLGRSVVLTANYKNKNKIHTHTDKHNNSKYNVVPFAICKHLYKKADLSPMLHTLYQTLSSSWTNESSGGSPLQSFKLAW